MKENLENLEKGIKFGEVKEQEERKASDSGQLEWFMYTLEKTYHSVNMCKCDMGTRFYYLQILT